MVSGALAAMVKTRFSRRKNAFSLIRLWRTNEISAAPCGAHFSSRLPLRTGVDFPPLQRTRLVA
jgi:hypothetical protein